MATYEVVNMKEIAALVVEMKKLIDRGRMIKCILTSKGNKSKEQLGYYWDVILTRVQAKFLEDGSRVSLKYLNNFFNQMFNYFEDTKTFKNHKGEEVIIIVRETKSKSGASKEQMSSFIDKVIQWCNENGIYIPPPQKN